MVTGRTRGPADAQGFGKFTGQGGIGALSKFPIDESAVQNFSDLLWRDLPGAELPIVDGAPFPSPEALDVQRLSSTAHWVLPITLPDGPLYVLTYQATPPVFDGPEDRNGLRNKDETRFWSAFLDGQLGPAPQGRFAIMGGSNLDPNDSDGYVDTMKSLLEDERLQDPRPSSRGAVLAADQGHITDNALDTVDWPARRAFTRGLHSAQRRLVGRCIGRVLARTGATGAWCSPRSKPASACMGRLGSALGAPLTDRGHTKNLKHLVLDFRRIHPCNGIHVSWAGLIDEDIRQDHRAELEP